jgi:site-specific DNA recombinase
MDGQLDSEGFGRFYKPLEKRLKELEAEIPRLEADIDLSKVSSLTTEQILSEAHDLYGRWPKLEQEEKRRVVESITERIVIGKDEINVTLCSLPSNDEMTKRQRSLNDE